ncbi:unnamed protein product [Ilex paraguariensis]|uniref:non-specific serine/threonine protein kinase n=1 Tax=Ilex paraguariensis TaxID=185542 RepID=A0ABC8S3R0_9AQUA
MAAYISLASLLSLFTVFAASQSVKFVYNGFNETNLTLVGATVIRPSGALKLTNKSHHVIGSAFHPIPIPMFNTSSSAAPNASSFSTSFVFAIVSPSSSKGGFGFAFTLAPAMQFPGAQDGHYLGILNETNDGDSSNHIFMVEFDTVAGFKMDSDTQGNHIGININNMNPNASEPAAYFVNGTNKKREVPLESGKAIYAWIDYDGVKKLVNVTIAPVDFPKPSRPLMSESIDLSPVLKNRMYAGFSAATGQKASFHYILGWSFRVNGMADRLNLSRLPIPPNETKSSSKIQIKKALIATFCAVVVLFLLGTLFTVFIYRPTKQFEVLEDWELDCPHRFRYRDLNTATKGFKDSELIGVGGFGKVYKGVLPNTGAEIAVKKISNNSVQGIREFAAEIESLGRLRHKHLVNLQGWCKRKNDLLLVYDYIPNGSLASILFSTKKNFVLSWEHRFNIVKGIAAGLLYLHEEWEQVVIHRDVKSSNVLIDADMNGRLGDFGLARLYDHGKHSHTTHVVGTIGYIAPELIQTGKASKSSDVFAYGVLLLEVACGRGPIVHEVPDPGHVILVNWVIECLQMGRILDAVDPKLNSMYVVEEMELVLGLGLICSHPKPETRPTMREVTRYLNGDEPVPISNTISSVDSRQFDDITTRFLDVLSTDMITTSYRSSSIGKMSSSSFDSARQLD